MRNPQTFIQAVGYLKSVAKLHCVYYKKPQYCVQAPVMPPLVASEDIFAGDYEVLSFISAAKHAPATLDWVEMLAARVEELMLAGTLKVD